MFIRNRNYLLKAIIFCLVIFLLRLFYKFYTKNSLALNLPNLRDELNQVNNLTNTKDGLQILTQYRRRSRIRSTCFKLYESIHGFPNLNLDSYLVDDVTKTIYCYNHKAATSTWMSGYLQLISNEEIRNKLLISGATYRIKEILNPKSSHELLSKVSSGEYFTFTVIRHPFDRILSAFRDRILSGCTDQSKTHVPRIFRSLNIAKNNLFGMNGCIKSFPSFTQFLKYILLEYYDDDPHWSLIYSNCSPCVINYNAIIKLETHEDDKNYVMRESGLEKTIHLETQHQSLGGKTEKFRYEFYSRVPCIVLNQLYLKYKYDFDLFGYEIEQFTSICI